MNILQTIADFGIKSGGTSTCTYNLISSLNKINCPTKLLTHEVKDPEDKQIGTGEEWIISLQNNQLTSYGYSRNAKYFFEKNNEFDLLHTNGLWMYCNHITCKTARIKGIPYIISPHGMLYPQALRRSYWKKWFFIQFHFKKDILRATCIHVTCNQEMKYVRQFGYKGPIAVIPNLLELPKECKRQKIARHKFGFLGRFHSRKGVEKILYAASLLKNRQDDFDIMLIGKGDSKYENFLKSEIIKLQLNNVHFLGFIDGQEKNDKLASLSTLFVPSDFENFGMIIPEALSVGTPVMASLGTPWEELNTHNCGWWTECSPENIANIMTEVLDMPIHKLEEMGNNGKGLIEENYNPERVVIKMKQLYEWILNGGNKPEFVYE